MKVFDRNSAKKQKKIRPEGGKGHLTQMKMRKKLILICLMLAIIIVGGTLYNVLFLRSEDVKLVWDLNKYVPNRGVSWLQGFGNGNSSDMTFVCRCDGDKKTVVLWHGNEIVECGPFACPIVVSDDGNKLAYQVVDTLNDAIHYVEWNGNTKSEKIIKDVIENEPLYISFSRDGNYTALMCGIKKERKYRVYFKDFVSDGFLTDDPAVYISLNGERLAYEITKDAKEHVVCGDVVGKGYDEVDSPIIFSSDGRQFAYSAHRDGKNYVIVDGVEINKAHDARDPAFSPMGSCFAYIIRKDGKDHVVLNGVESDGHDEIVDKTWLFPEGNNYNLAGLWFSSDGRHLAYVAKNKATHKEYIVLDGKAGSEYSNVDNFSFDAGGDHYIYTATHADGQMSIVHDGKESRQYEKIAGLVLSPDGNKFASIVGRTGKWTVFVDGKALGTYDTELRHMWPLVFSKDGRHLAYRIWSTPNIFQKIINKVKPIFPVESFHIVLDGKVGPSCYFATPPVFTADGKMVYYAIRNEDDLKLLRITVDLK